MEGFYAINEKMSEYIWGAPMLCLFIFVGLMFSIRTGFFQIRGIRTWFSETLLAVFRDKKVRKASDGKSISQFQALTSALAACMGTGNIVGVATALYSGGPGAVFWMIASAVLGMMTCCAENILGIKYRIKNDNGEYAGGAMYYIARGLGYKKTAIVFSIFLSAASFGIGNMTQANSVSGALKASFGISENITGLILAVLVGAVIMGGIKRIASVAEKLIPAISIVFMLAASVILFINAKNIPSVCALILKEAFNLKSAAGGAIGYGISRAMRYGISRGVFSNEAGLGSSAIIHSAADAKSPAVQGMWGIAEVFLDTVVMCTVTALVILTSGVFKPGGQLNGAALSSAAFETVFGRSGEVFVSGSVVIFAFATLIGWSYYGQKGAEYILGVKAVPVYRIIYIGAVFLGSVLNIESVWSLSDTLNGFMAVPNLFALVLLSGEAVRELSYYKEKKKTG